MPLVFTDEHLEDTVKESIIVSIAAAVFVVACAGEDAVVGATESNVSEGGYDPGGDEPPNYEDGLPIGAICAGEDQSQTQFAGRQVDEVGLTTEYPVCASGICLENHFQGRHDCPYGQPHGLDLPLSDPRVCVVPESGERVTVAVLPQLVERPPSLASICTCRCAGPGPGPFCTCPDDMQCAGDIVPLGLGSSETEGSYCIPLDSEFDPSAPQTPCTADPEDPSTGNCGPARPYLPR